MAPEPRIAMRTLSTRGAREGQRPENVANEPPPEGPRKMLEYRVYFSDFRDVDGVQLPHHITRGTATATTEEWDVKSYELNPQLKADRFKVS
jgi:hypothetical protein